MGKRKSVKEPDTNDNPPKTSHVYLSSSSSCNESSCHSGVFSNIPVSVILIIILSFIVGMISIEINDEKDLEKILPQVKNEDIENIQIQTDTEKMSKKLKPDKMDPIEVKFKTNESLKSIKNDAPLKAPPSKKEVKADLKRPLSDKPSGNKSLEEDKYEEMVRNVEDQIIPSSTETKQISSKPSEVIKKSEKEESKKEDQPLSKGGAERKDGEPTLTDLYMKIESMAEEVLSEDPDNEMAHQLAPHLEEVLRDLESGKVSGLRETLLHIKEILMDLKMRLKEAKESKVSTPDESSSKSKDQPGDTRVPVDEVIPDPKYIAPLGIPGSESKSKDPVHEDSTSDERKKDVSKSKVFSEEKRKDDVKSTLKSSDFGESMHVQETSVEEDVDTKTRDNKSEAEQKPPKESKALSGQNKISASDEQNKIESRNQGRVETSNVKDPASQSVKQVKSSLTDSREKNLLMDKQKKESDKQTKSTFSGTKEKTSHTDKQDETSHIDEQDKTSHTDKQNKKSRTNQQDKASHTDKQDTTPRTDKQDKSSHIDTQDKMTRSRQDKTSDTDKQDKPSHTDGQEKVSRANKQDDLSQLGSSLNENVKHTEADSRSQKDNLVKPNKLEEDFNAKDLKTDEKSHDKISSKENVNARTVKEIKTEKIGSEVPIAENAAQSPSYLKESSAEKENLAGKSLKLAESLIKENPKEALAQFETHMKTTSSSPHVLLGRAKALEALAEKEQSNLRLEEAIDAYENIFHLFEASPSSVPKDIARDAGIKGAELMNFRGQWNRSMKLLEKLSIRFPVDTKLQNRIGVLFLMMNRDAAAKQIFESILKISPNDGIALVHYGFILKLEGKNYLSAIDYLEKGIQSGAEGVHDSRFYYQLGDALQRIGQSEKAYKYYDAAVARNLFLNRYQRSIYNMDRLSSKPLWTKKETTYEIFFNKLESHWKDIKEEGLKALTLKWDPNDKVGFRPEFENLQEKGYWSFYDLFVRGKKMVNNCKVTPITCSLIENFTPAASCRRGQSKFSMIEPGTHVFPHTGPTNCRLRSHLGLMTPKGASMKVGNATLEWQEGKVFIFDDSYEHEVWHKGTGRRLILIVDVWHPDLTELEKKTLKAI